MNRVQGRTIVITGASSGTGRAAARQLHAGGARVLPVGGSAETIAPVAQELAAPVLWADLACFAEVRQLAARIRAMTDRIDVLVLNAGAIIPRQRQTPDGVEANLQVNAISHWLLLQLLADKVKGGRVIATSSHTHIRAHVEVTALGSAKGLGWHGVYARAKLVQGILLREFARRNPNVDVGDFHPGVIASQIGRHLGPLGAMAAWAARPFLAKPEDGARRLLHLVTADEPLDSCYFEKDRPHIGAPQLIAAPLARQLWKLAESLTNPVHSAQASHASPHDQRP